MKKSQLFRGSRRGVCVMMLLSQKLVDEQRTRTTNYVVDFFFHEKIKFFYF